MLREAPLRSIPTGSEYQQHKLAASLSAKMTRQSVTSRTVANSARQHCALLHKGVRPASKQV
jgi:hypothetical protein